MTNRKDNLDEIEEQARELIKIEIELAKARMVKKMGVASAGMVVMLLVVFSAFFMSLFLSVALALFLGSWWGNYQVAFLVVAILYLFIIVAVVLSRESFWIPLMSKAILKNVYEEEDA